MSSKTDEKRKEFAERVGSALKDGIIPWQNLGIPLNAPENAVSERSYKGINALYLLRQASGNGYTDLRWLTVKDANKAGHKVKAGEKGTSLEYWEAHGEKPGIRSYSVFNVKQLEAFPVRDRGPEVLPDYNKADAALKNSGIGIPKSHDEYAYRDALEKAVAEAGKNTPVFGEAHTQDLKDLRVSLASMFLMWETHIPVTQDTPKTAAQSWGDSIHHNPSELFKAVRDAGKLVGEMLKGLELEQSNAAGRESAPQNAATEKKEKFVTPKVGDRVTFHAKDGTAKLTGEVAGMDDLKGTVTIQCGSKNIPVFRGKGSFSEAPPLSHEQTKENAKALAQKHVGENGKVFFARDEGVYKGTIVETTPTFAVQEVQKGMAVLHRLKDLGEKNEERVQKGQNVVIYKEAGKVTVSPNQTHQEKGAGIER